MKHHKCSFKFNTVSEWHMVRKMWYKSYYILQQAPCVQANPMMLRKEEENINPEHSKVIPVVRASGDML